MKQQNNRSKDDALLDKLLSEQPGDSGGKLSKAKLISIITITVGVITIIASISQIAGITVNSFFDDMPIEKALRIDYQYRCSGEGLIDDTISGKKRLGILFPSDKLTAANQAFITSKPFNATATDTYACVHPSLSVDLVSNSRNETIKVAPYLAIKIVEKASLPKNIRFGFFGTARGAGGQQHYALGIVSPMQDDISAAYIQPDQLILQYKSQSEVDFFTLASGEREAIVVFFNTFPGYKYKFQVGAFYSYNGKRHIKWIDEQFQATGTTEFVDEWIPGENPILSKEIHTINIGVQNEFDRQILQVSDHLSKEPYFILSQMENER